MKISTGTSMHMCGRGLHVNKSLDAIMGPYVPSAKPEQKTRTGGAGQKYTDDQILQMRALHEFGNWSRARIAERYGLNADDVRRYLDYVTRARLVPTRKHLPGNV